MLLGGAKGSSNSNSIRVMAGGVEAEHLPGVLDKKGRNSSSINSTTNDTNPHHRCHHHRPGLTRQGPNLEDNRIHRRRRREPRGIWIGKGKEKEKGIGIGRGPGLDAFY